MIVINISTNAHSLQRVLPKRFAALLAAVKKNIHLFATPPNQLAPLTEQSVYLVKKKLLCKRLLQIKELPPACTRFLIAQLRKSTPEDLISLSLEEVSEEIEFGALISNTGIA